MMSSSELPIRVLLVDDHHVVRAGLIGILASEEGITVVGEACDGESAIMRFRELRPDVTLMDIRMPKLSGLDALRAIRNEAPDAKILMLTTYDTEEEIHRALSMGAAGYLLKDAPPAELIAALRCVAAGKVHISAFVGQRLAERNASAQLSEREVEVLDLVSKGLSNLEIASMLHVSDSTAKTHVRHIFQKLGAADRAEAVTIAMQRGILFLG